MHKVRGPTVKRLPWSKYDEKGIVLHARVLKHWKRRLNRRMLTQRLLAVSRHRRVY